MPLIGRGCIACPRGCRRPRNVTGLAGARDRNSRAAASCVGAPGDALHRGVTIQAWTATSNFPGTRLCVTAHTTPSPRNIMQHPSASTRAQLVAAVTLQLLSTVGCVYAGTLPTWAPTYDMAKSTAFMPCNESGFTNATLAASFGIVDFDWCVRARMQPPSPPHTQPMKHTSSRVFQIATTFKIHKTFGSCTLSRPPHSSTSFALKHSN